MAPIGPPAPKHQVIANDLRQRIREGKIQPGEALPSYRALMRSHRTTVGTVRQAMLALQADALVESIPGIGCVVAKPEPRRRRYMVGYASLHPTQEMSKDCLLDELHLLHDELDRWNCTLAVRFVPSVSISSCESLVGWAKELDGVLLSEHVPVALARAMASSGVPTVLIGEPVDGECPPELSNVTIDVNSMVHLAVSHLVSLGHRRILLCTHQGNRYFDQITDSFRRALAAYGLGKEGIEWLSPYPTPFRAAVLYDWLTTLRQPPTAILVENGARAAAMVRILNRNGWPVPERMSILGITATARAEEIGEDTSAVLTPMRDLILRATRMIADLTRAQTRVARREIVPTVYLPGKTCRALVSQSAGEP